MRLVSLYRKRDLGQVYESDCKDILTRQATLKRLKKLHDERTNKFERMDKTTRKKLIGKATSDLGWPKKLNDSELIKAISRLAISGFATHERRRNEVIQTVRTLDQLTEALNWKEFELKRS